jgi:uncharacterized protein YjbI with pentapeptide repeats
MKIELKNRWTGEVQYTCKLSAEVAGKSYGLQLGVAIKAAHVSGADLRGADLRGADLTGAVLRGADLTGADLRGADLTGADLTGADLTGAVLRDADLRGADLRGADLTGAVLRDADLRGAVLRDADLRGADLTGCPVKIKDIHKAVYEAASKPGALDMKTWHTCGTTHCRAGWVVALAGEGGAALEYAFDTPTAATLIYMASDPTLAKVPDFYCNNEVAMADMARLAGVTA